MVKTNIEYGLEWKKIDLHIHTPASLEDRMDKSLNAEVIIEKAKSLQLDAICISDHNTGAWVDKVSEAAKGKGIVVFPGVEITVQGGETNVHILAVFDPSINTEHINSLLSKLDIPPAKRGRIDVIAQKTVNETINLISGSDGIPLLAHADSNSGVLHDMKGVGRTEIIRNPNLLGVHINNEKTADFLDGTDPNYKTKLAVFRASDAHTLEEIGKEVTYFKLGALTIDALKQCFYDPDIRIRRTELIPGNYPKVVSIEFSQGFLEGQCCKFHGSLNSIIGGKGVGKSLIIEFLRFALNQPSSIPDLMDDAKGKLSKQLGIDGKIKVLVQTRTGEEFCITREYDGGENSTVVENTTKSLPYEGDVRRLFPVLFYSQNEIIDISRDRSAQLKLIDNLIDIQSYNSAILDLQDKLKRNLTEYIESLHAKQEAADLEIDITTIKQELKELDKVLGDPMFEQKKQWDHRLSLLETVFFRVQQLDESIKEFVETNKEIGLPVLSEEDQTETNLKACYSVIESATDTLFKNINSTLQKFRKNVQGARRHEDAIQKAFQEWEKLYDDFVKSAGGQHQALAIKRTKRSKYLQELETKLTDLKEKVAHFKDIEEKRDNLLDLFDKTLDERYKARADVYKALTTMSNGKLKLAIEPKADKTDYIAEIIALAYGTRIRTQSLQVLAEQIEPRRFVEIIIHRKLSDLIDLGGLTLESAEKLIEIVLSSEVNTEKCLKLPFGKILQDVPNIQFLKDDGKYYPLNELSTGQKCTALLLIALSEGSMPVIIDQPEDALDVATVYYDVVSRLRERKDLRQFILTTHNPNIAVSSDTDKYHVLKATEASGEIICCGSIDSNSIREAVIGHLEGGNDPYTLRGKKYGIIHS